MFQKFRLSKTEQDSGQPGNVSETIKYRSTGKRGTSQKLG